jgi:hypothetical protein
VLGRRPGAGSPLGEDARGAGLLFGGAEGVALSPVAPASARRLTWRASHVLGPPAPLHAPVLLSLPL